VEVLGAPIPAADYIRTIRELTSFVGDSFTVCLQQRPGNILIQDECLSFYEMTSQLVRSQFQGTCAVQALLDALSYPPSLLKCFLQFSSN